MNSKIEHDNLLQALSIAITNVFNKPQQIYFTDDRDNSNTDNKSSSSVSNTDEQERLKGNPPHQV